MKVSRIRNAVVLVITSSALVLGCELIVDFDRTKIPVDGTDGSIVTPEGGVDATFDTSVPDAADAADTAVPDAAPDAFDAADGD